jgi:hypothetical protein
MPKAVREHEKIYLVLYFLRDYLRTDRMTDEFTASLLCEDHVTTNHGCT